MGSAVTCPSWSSSVSHELFVWFCSQPWMRRLTSGAWARGDASDGQVGLFRVVGRATRSVTHTFLLFPCFSPLCIFISIHP